MAGKAVECPDSFDPIEECSNGLLFLRAGLDALKATGDDRRAAIRQGTRVRAASLIGGEQSAGLNWMDDE